MQKLNKDLFRPQEKNEELVGYEVPYLSAIDALMYLANTTRSDIAFSINLLARYSFPPTRSHRNGIKHMIFYYSKDCSSDLVGYANAGY